MFLWKNFSFYSTDVSKTNSMKMVPLSFSIWMLKELKAASFSNVTEFRYLNVLKSFRCRNYLVISCLATEFLSLDMVAQKPCTSVYLGQIQQRTGSCLRSSVVDPRTNPNYMDLHPGTRVEFTVKVKHAVRLGLPHGSCSKVNPSRRNKEKVSYQRNECLGCATMIN